jgi:hypothetical protein
VVGDHRKVELLRAGVNDLCEQSAELFMELRIRLTGGLNGAGEDRLFDYASYDDLAEFLERFTPLGAEGAQINVRHTLSLAQLADPSPGRERLRDSLLGGCTARRNRLVTGIADILLTSGFPGARLVPYSQTKTPHMQGF